MPTVSLSDIEDVDRSDLNSRRLNDLENGQSSFDEVLNSSSDPIALDRSNSPYRIVDGRHRIYLARDKSYRAVTAVFV